MQSCLAWAVASPAPLDDNIMPAKSLLQGILLYIRFKIPRGALALPESLFLWTISI